MYNHTTKIFSASSIGNTHLAKQVPNQDSVDSWIAPDGIHFCVALSDGHGSPAHPLSQYGSRFAVAISLQVFKENFQSDPSRIDASNLFQQVISRWTDECIAHYSEQDPEQSVVQGSPLKLYGATLCIAYSSGDSISVASLGDSTVYFRNHSGLYARFLIHDESPGESTYSLCQAEPLRHLDVLHIPYSSGLLVLSTDGIIKSLRTSSDYALIADYYLSLLTTNSSPEHISADLESQLDSFSREGSGDDCTMALVYVLPDTRLSDTSIAPTSDQLPKSNQLTTRGRANSKKKVTLLPVVLLTPLVLLVITLLPLSLILNRPLRNQILSFYRNSLCSNQLKPAQTQSPPLLIKGQ